MSRIYKILAKNPTDEQFLRIFEMNCRRCGVRSTRRTSSTCGADAKSGAACRCARVIRGDLINQIVSLCRYH